MANIIKQSSIENELDIYPTCSAACPVNTITRDYVDLIARGKYEEAFEKIRQFNPFPSVCSLICHHPCEQDCKRQYIDEPVALRNLKRFVVENTLEYRRGARRRAQITHPQSVGIIGSGPAGLTVAQDCIKAGYTVTVYESLPRPGGMLGCAIPKYRLPDNILQEDLDDIIGLGVEIRTGVNVGRDITLNELQKRHNAIVLALGLSESRDLPLVNRNHPDVLLAIPFLRAAALGHPYKVLNNVIVIGGGNVAIDVARTALRLGAENVKMVCLENEEEMPAWDWECCEAKEEGIEIIYRRGPLEVIIENNKVRGLIVRDVERVFDENGRFSPKYYDDCLSMIDGQMIIITIGQRSNLSLVQNTSIKLNKRGLIEFNPSTMSTSQMGVFACGEVVTGPGSAIEAVANGHRAAQAILNYLKTNLLIPVKEKEIVKVGQFSDDVIAKVQRIQRMTMPTISPDTRKKEFMQFELGYDEQMALSEARRCLTCAAGAVVDEQKCEACLTCLRVCPFGIPVVDDVASMSSDLCQACGLCAVECPAFAINIKRFAIGDIRNRIIKIMETSKDQITRVEIICAQDVITRQELTDRIIKENSKIIAKIPVTCAARAEETDMMKPFELGAKTVTVKRCRQCRYKMAQDRITKRVARVKGILDAVGVGGDKLILI